MSKASKALDFFMQMAKVHTVMSRRFDGRLGGLGWSEFIILYRLSCSQDEKMRRIDLAEAVGLTASGVTRLLLPMEKIGLVKKETNEHDARVSMVKLASGGKRKLDEAMERAEAYIEDIVPNVKMKDIEDFVSFLTGIA
jgi:DNA-binding MarR family transcriptional regulator